MEVITNKNVSSSSKLEIWRRFTTQEPLLANAISDADFLKRHVELSWFSYAINEAYNEFKYLEKEGSFLSCTCDKVIQLLEQKLASFTMGFDINYIIALSGEVQEKAESKDYFLVILPYEDCSQIKNQMILEFSADDYTDFCFDKIHYIRKQLNLTKGGSLAVCKDPYSNKFRTVGVLSKEASEQYPRFYFSKRLQWEFYLPKANDICKTCDNLPGSKLCKNSTENKPCKNYQDLQSCKYTVVDRPCKLCRLRYAQGTLMMPIINFYPEITKSLAQYLNGKNHTAYEEVSKLIGTVIKSTDGSDNGAVIIFSDTTSIIIEANRLSSMGRGLKLPLPMPLIGEDGDILVKRLTCIDGAILVDFCGFCYAYGVILDGEAINEGNIGRGARFNSTRAYVDSRTEQDGDNAIYIGIVKSEDAMLDILYGQGKKQC